jgi:small subunit ribosomal protein S17
MSQVEATEKKARLLTGVVVSNKMDGSITVAIERKVKHPLYHKYMRRTTKVHADDPQNTCGMGDIVTVESCRPLSKTKHFRLVEIKERSK